MNRSHLTQQFLNYFDAKDARVRQGQCTLDAQLLNAIALQLEDQSGRIQREIDGRFLATCPLNIDNGGVYYRLQIPQSVTLPTDPSGQTQPPNGVYGIRNGIQVPLHPYDDRLPVPDGVEVDPNRDSVPLSEPVLASWLAPAGGLLLGTLPTPVTLPVPNRVCFWVTGIPTTGAFVQISLLGKPSSCSAWVSEQVSVGEQVVVRQDGLFETSTLWESIDQVRITGLPPNASIQMRAFQVALPYVPDSTRPYTDPNYRDQTFTRYWRCTSAAVQEVFVEGADRGFLTEPNIITTATTSTPILDVAVEPNTRGLILVSNPSTGPQLAYQDREIPFPDQLQQTALFQPPYYGLLVTLDTDFSVGQRAWIRILAGTRLATPGSWRLKVQLPTGQTYLFAKDPANMAWTLQAISPSAWVQGTPPDELFFPLLLPGTYVFSLETRDAAGSIVSDVVPFLNQHLTVFTSFPLSDIPRVRGVCFDSLQRLWVWDGQFLHPYRFTYNAYVFDAASRSLYLTQTYDEVIIQ